MKQRTKGQHYLPRAAYLNYFAIEGAKKPVVYVYPMDESGLRLEDENPIPPDKLCKEKDLYEAPKRPVNAVENGLEKTENNYRRILNDKLIKGEIIDNDEREAVALFVSTLTVRSPTTKAKLQDFFSRTKETQQKLQDYYDPGKKLRSEDDIEYVKNTSFADFIIMATKANMNQFSNFLFLHNKRHRNIDSGGYFITSDKPVTKLDFTMMNSLFPAPHLSKSLEVLLPLTPYLLLFINNRGLEGHKEIDLNFITEANNRIALFAITSGKRVMSPFPVSRKVADRILKHVRQSFILKYENSRSVRQEKTSKVKEMFARLFRFFSRGG